MAHPLPIHGGHFEVLSPDGRPPLPRDAGLRDAVFVQQPVQLLVRFMQPSGRSPFTDHCQILEHEGAKMMGRLTTV
jgi:blue copper oxidase